jgi:hypothetical protein
MVGFTSCFEEIDNWYTNTESYDGRFVVSKTCEEYSSDDTAIEDAEEVMIYNSAANVANEIIVDTHIAGFSIKGKFGVTGSSAEFKAGEPVNNISRVEEVNDDDMYIIFGGNYYYPSDLGDPEELGEEYDGVQLYARLSLEEGKITPKGATTIGGNQSDGVYLNITLYSDYFVVESYETPQDTWDDPTIPELAWRIKEGSRENADGWEEHWTLEGYRYTGLPEDIGALPPIIVK